MLRKLFAPALLAYVASVVLLNFGFSDVPLIPSEVGVFSTMAILAGLVFVLLDYAQRQAGHYVLAGMVAGTLLSYLLASPFVATVSAIAFIVSELADYVLYTVTKKPFHQRVLISSLVSTPIDTVVFLAGISQFSVGTFILMVASKMAAAVFMWVYYRTKPGSVSVGYEDPMAPVGNPYAH